MPNRIEIIIADIQIAAKQLGLTLDDAERIAVLKSVKSCDVQAGPGSGKTTVLMAKLAILARKWPAHDRGICVLSHTNVARREIEQRLNGSPEMRRLLHYPHFIGTIQTFVDQFIAIPFLRRERIEVVAIDNDRFGARAMAIFLKNHRNAFFGLQKRYNERAELAITTLRLDGAHMGVTHGMAQVKGFPGANTMTGRALVAVKQQLRSEGYFRFDDMYAFAEACLFKVKYVSPALRHRFPWVFIDELQDTSVTQDRVIEQIFGVEPCILQRFGDKNQSIFNSHEDTAGGPSLFDRRETLPLNTTYRFGQGLASIVSRLTAVVPQSLVGNPKREECEHTIFVFERSGAKKVVPLFGDLVLKTVKPEIWQTQPVCVVGGRVNSATHTKDNFPAFLGDYFDGYKSPNSAKPTAPDTFLGYILEARQKWIEEGTGAQPYAHAVAGILALFRRTAEDGLEEFPKTKTALQETLMTTGALSAFQKVIWNMINPMAKLEAKPWEPAIAELFKILGVAKPSASSQKFVSWENLAIPKAPLGKKSPKLAENLYLHRVGKLELPIRFDSIHGVKGETHAATLVVQTFARQHDLPEIIPALVDEMHGSALRDAVHGHCKRLFVGMSRPMSLLCLAVSAEHISEKYQTALIKCGWKVVRVG